MARRTGRAAAAAVFVLVLAGLPSSGQAQYDGGWLQLGAVVPLTGGFADEWAGVADALHVAAAAVNAGNGERGAVATDAHGVRMYFKVNVTVVDDGSTAAGHAAARAALLSRTRPVRGGVPPPSHPPSALPPPDAFAGVLHALIGVHPVWAAEDAAAADAASVAYFACCNPRTAGSQPAPPPAAASAFVWDLLPSAASHPRAHLAALVRRGVASIVLLRATADAAAVDACSTVAADADALGLAVEADVAYDTVLHEADVPSLWSTPDASSTALTGRLSAPAWASASAAAAAVAVGASRDTVRQALTTAASVARGGLNVVMCGLALDASDVAAATLIPVKVPIESFFLSPAATYRRWPASAAANATWTPAERAAHAASYARTHPACRGGMAAAPGDLGMPTSTSPAAVRYVTTALPWHADVRAADDVLGDSAQFSAAFQLATGCLPGWQAAGAAAALALSIGSLTRAYTGCTLMYPNLHVAFYDPTAVLCATADTVGYDLWLGAIATSSQASLLGGDITFDTRHRNTGAGPVTLQLQAAKPAAAAGIGESPTDTRYVIVAPGPQARCSGCGAATVPSGALLLPYPAPAGFVFPIPGSVFIPLASQVGGAVMALACVTAAGIAALGAYMVHHRFKTPVKKARLSFVVSLVLGGVLAACAPLADVGAATPAAVIARLALPMVGLTLVTVPVCGKAVQVTVQHAAVNNMRVWKFRNHHTWRWLMGPLIVDAILIAGWVASGGGRTFRAVAAAPSPAASAWVTVGVVVWKGVELVLTAVAVYRARHVILPFNEGWALAATAYHTVVVGAVAGVAALILGGGAATTPPEVTAATHPAYALPARAYTLGTATAIDSGEAAGLAALIAHATLCLWFAAATAGIALVPKVRAALAERNAVEAATRARALMKAQARDNLAKNLAAADAPPDLSARLADSMAATGSCLSRCRRAVSRVAPSWCCPPPPPPPPPLDPATGIDVSGIAAVSEGAAANDGAARELSGVLGGESNSGSSAAAPHVGDPSESMLAGAKRGGGGGEHVSGAAMARIRKAETALASAVQDNGILREQLALARAQLEALRQEALCAAVATHAPPPPPPPAVPVPTTSTPPRPPMPGRPPVGASGGTGDTGGGDAMEGAAVAAEAREAAARDVFRAARSQFASPVAAASPALQAMLVPGTAGDGEGEGDEAPRSGLTPAQTAHAGLLATALAASPHLAASGTVRAAMESAATAALANQYSAVGHATRAAEAASHADWRRRATADYLALTPSPSPARSTPAGLTALPGGDDAIGVATLRSTGTVGGRHGGDGVMSATATALAAAARPCPPAMLAANRTYLEVRAALDAKAARERASSVVVAATPPVALPGALDDVTE